MAGAKETPKRAARRTDREIAQAKLDAADTRVRDLQGREDRLRAELDSVFSLLESTRERRKWLAEDPALKVDGAGAPPATPFQPDA